MDGSTRSFPGAARRPLAVAAEPAARPARERAPAVAAPQTTERELAFSLISSLSDDTKREAVRLLLRSLTNAVDEGRVSYAQIMLKVVAESSAVDAITEEARQAGANPTVKDM